MDYLLQTVTLTYNVLPPYPVEVTFKKEMVAMNIAQMWDMYWALENAYEVLEGSTEANTHLLNATQKNTWNQRIAGFIDNLYDGTTHSYPISFGVNLHEAQPGNWPLIGFIAADYMLLGFNGTFSSGLFPPILPVQVRGYALASSMLNNNVSTSTTSRMYYFNYQTSGGKRYWAEALVNLMMS